MQPPPEPTAPPELVLDSVYVPRTDLTSHADVTYVLNQQPGKLRIKDVKVRERLGWRQRR